MPNKTIAIIPARSGSMRLPDKNIRVLGRLPLMHYTILSAKLSGCFDEILFSSDSPAYCEVANKIPGINTILRPAELANNYIDTWDVIHHYVNQPYIKEKYDNVAMLLPTCPFRSVNDIKKCTDLFECEPCDSVITISKMRDPVQISFGFDLSTNQIDIEPFSAFTVLTKGSTRSQDFIDYYRPNGGVYLSSIERYLQEKNFFTGNVKAVIQELTTVDIDEESDFMYAEYLLHKRYISEELIFGTEL